MVLAMAKYHACWQRLCVRGIFFVVSTVGKLLVGSMGMVGHEILLLRDGFEERREISIFCLSWHIFSFEKDCWKKKLMIILVTVQYLK